MNERFGRDDGGRDEMNSMGLLNNSGSEAVEASEKTTHISERKCSKKFVQQGRSRFDARSVLSVREHGKRATMSVRAVSAKPENAAGGFFQHSHKGFERGEGGRDEMNSMCLIMQSDSEKSQHPVENLEWS